MLFRDLNCEWCCATISITRSGSPEEGEDEKKEPKDGKDGLVILFRVVTWWPLMCCSVWKRASAMLSWLLLLLGILCCSESR